MNQSSVSEHWGNPRFTKQEELFPGCDRAALPPDPTRGLALADNLQTDNVPAPGCVSQPLYDPIGDSTQPPTQYQQVFRQP